GFDSEMGTEAKKAMKNLKRATTKTHLRMLIFWYVNDDKLPWKVVMLANKLENTAMIFYVGRIPSGFYEKEMEGAHGLFWAIWNHKRLRIARNKKTGKSRHFGFIEFESLKVAKIVADTMHNYLLFEHLLRVYVIPLEHVHPKLGFNYCHKPLDSVQIERKRHDKERTLGEHKKLVEKIIKHEKK
ncbi:hypothetical protein CR513_09813, partial [Mucuna pruriens]